MKIFVIFNFLLFLHQSSGENIYCMITKADRNPVFTINILNTPSGPCTHVNGFIDLRFTATPSVEIMDNLTKSLSAVVDITGYLRISFLFDQNYNYKFSMPNLKAIHGRKLSKNSFSLLFDDNKVAMIGIDLGNLSVIGNGNVGFLDNRGLCNMDKLINWTEYFTSSTQKVVVKQTSPCKPSPAPMCHESCPKNNFNRSYCYGSESNQCQKLLKCRKRKCSLCYNINLPREDEECCHDNCEGGCFGPGSDQCHACRFLIYGKECVDSCPPNTYRLGNLCLGHCQNKFYTQDESCVEVCREGYEANGSVCKPCPNEQCALVCHLTDEKTNDNIVFNGNNAHKLANCTKLEGSLVINDVSFHNMLNNVAISSVEELEVMQHLEEVTGEIYLGFKYAPKKIVNDPRMKSLFFLKNLKKIKGISYGNTNSKYSLSIINSPFEFLGLKKLQSVSKSILLFNNTRLTYGNTLNWTHLGVSQVNIMGLLPTQYSCDAQCTVEGGCWGPGPELCVNCASYTGNDSCVNSCNQLPLHFTPSNGSTTCVPCHEECKENCIGPHANQCIGLCKNFKINSTCVNRCPSTMFIDKVDNYSCRPCSDVCFNDEDEEKSICSGPNSLDCDKCHAVVLNKSGDTVEYCIKESTPCPLSYYEVYPRSLDRPWFQRYAAGGNNLRVCYPCASSCGNCTSSTECHYCLGNWYKDKCVRDCNYDDVAPPPINKTFSTNSTCPQCHPLCKDGCTGLTASDCNKCISFYIQKSKNIVTCVATCASEPDKRYGLCEEKFWFFQMKIIVPSAIGLLFLLIFLLIIVCACALCKKKVELRKEKEKLFINDVYSNSNWSYSPGTLPPCRSNSVNSRPPNLNRLEIINRDDLILDTSNESLLGKGAFGEVFRAQWKLSNRQLQQRSEQCYSYASSSNNSSTHSSGILPNRSKSKLFALDVAVKMVNRDYASEFKQRMEELLEEAKVMASVNHPHCLPLIGVCMSEGRHCLVTAFMPMGSVDQYIRSNANKLTPSHLILWSCQIADGMEYLSQHGIIHRDLATRNVLMKSAHCVKITDFGLSKMLENDADQEIIVRSGRVPVRWLAVETLKHGVYSFKTDVWSYGVTLWEIFTLGQTPYGDVETVQVREEVIHGRRLPQPENTNPDLYKEMLKCWVDDPDVRPDFRTLKLKFNTFLNDPDYYFEMPTRDVILERQSSAPYNGYTPCNQLPPYTAMHDTSRTSFQSYFMPMPDASLCPMQEQNLNAMNQSQVYEPVES